MTEIKNKEENKPKPKKSNSHIYSVETDKEEIAKFNKTHAGFFIKKDNLFNKTSVEMSRIGKFDVKQDDIIIRQSTKKDNISVYLMNSTSSNFNKKKNNNKLNLFNKDEIDEDSNEND